MVFLTLLAAIITADNTKKAPKLADIGKDQFETELVKKNPPNTEDPNIKIATPKLAPDEIPKTKGPAKGFLNNVCINKPQIESPEPTKTAVIAFGTLKLRTMVSQLSLVTLPPKRLLKMSLKGIETEPKLIFKNHRITNKIDNNIKCFL